MIAEGVGALMPTRWPADPLWICAVRQADGRRVVFGRDGQPATVAAAVAASCAIPGFFAPVVIDGEAHLDGGVHSPTNADVLRDEALDLVIVSSPMSRRGRPRLAPDQAMRTWAGARLESEKRTLRRRGTVVVAFQPDDDVLRAMGFNAMDPARRASIATSAHVMVKRALAHHKVSAHLAPIRG
jgi:NTE family protein